VSQSLNTTSLVHSLFTISDRKQNVLLKIYVFKINNFLALLTTSGFVIEIHIVLKIVKVYTALSKSTKPIVLYCIPSHVVTMVMNSRRSSKLISYSSIPRHSALRYQAHLRMLVFI